MSIREQLSRKSALLKTEKEVLKRKFKNENAAESITSAKLHKTEIIFPSFNNRRSETERVFQWYFNGFIVNINGQLIIVDPGVDFYTRFVDTGLDLKNVAAIFISHEHIDHTASLPVLLDMILRLGKKIDLIIPSDCFRTRLPSYLQKEIISGQTNINLVKLTSRSYQIEKPLCSSALKTMKIVKLYHSAPQCYGFKLKLGICNLAYVSDTGYAKSIATDEGTFSPNNVTGKFIAIKSKHVSIKRAFENTTHAIVNINDIGYSRHATTHLTAWDIQDIFSGSELKRLYLQHQPPYNVRYEDNTKDYCDFFKGEPYVTQMPFNERKKLT